MAASVLANRALERLDCHALRSSDDVLGECRKVVRQHNFLVLQEIPEEEDRDLDGEVAHVRSLRTHVFGGVDKDQVVLLCFRL